ncbi:MAG: hypothetical protein K6F42_07725 [Bacteroidales bacterium]|nr:hypothetical protein [Bacteroidales bacterium]
MRRMLYALAALLALACTPSGYREAAGVDSGVEIYPDYAGVALPCNIAPMNFDIRTEADAWVAVFSGGGETLVRKGPKVRVPVAQWHALLDAAKGGELRITLYSREDGRWSRHPDIVNYVAPEPIDEYVTYRLIEPGYSGYGQLVLRQRRLSDFHEHDLYNNSLSTQQVDQQCINCHSFQNYGTENFQFHARQLNGGTFIAMGDRAQKVAFKSGDLMSNAVYPSWHPTEPLIAYSVNKVMQVFLTAHMNRLDVYDDDADLVLYDVESGEVSYIVHNPLAIETFPYWSADGRTLYYASAYLPELSLERGVNVAGTYDRMRYNLWSIPFDPETRTFGTPEMVFHAAAEGLSAVMPRPSPDGKYLLSSAATYGSFHIWHETADLYLTDLRTGETRPLDEANSPRAESFKAWSSNSRWAVFTTRRDDRAYTRLYICYFDEDGNVGKPFLLPQRDPSQNLSLFKSYNVPELTREAVRWTPKEIERALKGPSVGTTEVDRSPGRGGVPVTPDPDAVSGSSVPVGLPASAAATAFPETSAPANDIPRGQSFDQ